MRWTDRLRERLVRSRDELRLRRETMRAVPATLPAPAGDVGIHDRRSGVFGALIAVGSALLALGLIWGWQTWSNRSAEPIDDLLPMLVAGTADERTPGADAVETPGEAEAPGAVAGEDAAAVGDEATQPDSSDPGTSTEPTAPIEVLVHVSGAVVSPGVVVLAPGARVFEAVERAGGETPDADLDRVNLAAPVVDGERIHVPTHDEDVIPSLVPSVRPPSPAAATGATSEPVIDINPASASDLEALPGVGPAIAQAIVQTRVDRGPFLSLDELLEVPGIGDTKLAQLRPFAAIGP